MAGRWEDERDWREREARFGRGDREDNDFGRDGYRGSEDRTFQGRAPRGPVFGERETGVDYTGPGQGYRGSGSDAAGFDSPIRGADRGYQRSGREHSPSERDPAYRAAYGSQSIDYTHEGHDRPRGYEARALADARPDRDHGDRWDRSDGDRSQGRNFLDRAADSVASWFAGDRAPQDDTRLDVRRAAGHRGMGPQGYKRPDERITEEAHERLTEDAWVDASHIGVSVSGGEVTLSGTVTEREAKHRAERLVEDITGVTHVQNNLRVDRGGFLTRPAAGFGDSVQSEQMKIAPADPRTET